MRYYEGHISKRVGRIRRDIEDMKLLSPNPEENHSVLAIFSPRQAANSPKSPKAPDICHRFGDFTKIPE